MASGTQGPPVHQPDNSRRGLPGRAGLAGPGPVESSQSSPFFAEDGAVGGRVSAGPDRRSGVAGAGYLAGRLHASGGGAVLAFPAGCARTITGERPEATGRVIRGGSWDNNARNCRAAIRNRNEPQNRNDSLGFRVAAVPCARGGCPAGRNRPLSRPASRWAKLQPGPARAGSNCRTLGPALFVGSFSWSRLHEHSPGNRANHPRVCLLARRCAKGAGRTGRGGRGDQWHGRPDSRFASGAVQVGRRCRAADRPRAAIGG